MNPAATALPAAAEHLQPVPKVPGWSENMCFTGWDPERSVGLWLHMGRTPYDPQIWHEILAVHLPDGRVHVQKTFTRSRSSEDPVGDLLALRCEEPFRRWSVTYAGPMRTATEGALADGPLADGRERLVQLDLTFVSGHSPWHFQPEEWARTHYQQLGRYEGTLTVDGTTTPLAMLGWRDHSAGPRDLRPFVRHTLVAAQFEDGRSLFAVELCGEAAGAPVVFGRLDAGDVTISSEPAILPGIDDPRGPSARYAFTVATPSGPQDATAEMLCSLPITMFPPNDMTVGLSTEPEGYTLWMGQARFEFDGVTGYGHLERAARVGPRP